MMPEPNKNLIGQQLYQRRRGKRLSQRKLGNLADFTEDTVRAAEKNSSARPLYVIEGLAAALGLRLVLLDADDFAVVTEALRRKRAEEADQRAKTAGARAPLAMVRSPGKEESA